MPVLRTATGPTLTLNSEATNSSPIAEFMYFVPLISPDPVEVSESTKNLQRVRILKTTRNHKADSFEVVTLFEIRGDGYQKNIFDPTNNIRSRAQRLKEGGTLERQLDTITVAGAGKGRIEVEGMVSNQIPVVTQVRLCFNEGGQSPVTIGLHNIRLVDGALRFDNQLVARVNTLTFRRTTGRPKMEVTVASVQKANAGNNLWTQFVGGMKGAFANLLIKPLTVDKLGHATMLDFGRALTTGDATFTFPRAKNLKPTPVQNGKLEKAGG